MICGSCGCKDIDEGESRCPRCGRKFSAEGPRAERPPDTITPPAPPPSAHRAGPAAALAPQWRREVSERLQQLQYRRAQRGLPSPDLFSEPPGEDSGEEVPRPDPGQKILAFEDFAAQRIEPLIVEPPKSAPPEWQKQARGRAQREREALGPALSSASEAPRRPAEIEPEGESEADQRTAAEREVLCEHPVAPLLLRGMAGALDLAVVTVATGVFFATFHIMGGALHFNHKAGVATASAAAILFAFYFFVYIAYASETPGLQWIGLRVLDYDGEAPRAWQRVTRAIGMILSAAALGLGYVWAFADEEGLTWHDRMSKTFIARDPRYQQRFRYLQPEDPDAGSASRAEPARPQRRR